MSAELFSRLPDLRWRHVPPPWYYEQTYPIIERAIADAAPVDAILGI